MPWTRVATLEVASDVTTASLVAGASQTETKRVLDGRYAKNETLKSDVAAAIGADDTVAKAAAAAAAPAVATEVAKTGVVTGAVAGTSQAGSPAVGGFAGTNGRETELVVDKDGNVPSTVLSRWASRMGGFGGGGSTPTTDPAGAYVKNNRNMMVTSRGGVVPAASTNLFLAAWGDSLTDGWPRPPFAADHSDSWPGVLATRWKTGTVFNGGRQGESADEIALRQGGYVLLLTADGGQIPASGAVNVTCSQVVAWRLDRDWYCPGTLAGVPGMLYRAQGGQLTFTRTSSGAAVPVAADTAYVSTAGDARKTDVHVFFAGRNDIGYDSPAGDVVTRVVAAHIAMAERAGVGRRRFLTVGTTTATSETTGQANHSAVLSINNRLSQLYPDNFWDLRGYLVSQAIYDLGITPTSDDRSKMAGNTLPPSIMVDGTHFTPATAALIAAQIQTQLITRGWIA